MNEPAIVSYGRQHLDAYPVQEYRASLIRAFRDKQADFITLDSFPHGQRFLAASVAWGMDNGLLRNDSNQGDEQDIVSSFRLTVKGLSLITGYESK